MPHISDSEKRKQAELLVKLANERSRVKIALKLTWDHYGIAEETQAKMLECILDGNRMDEFKAKLEALNFKELEQP